MDCEVSVGAKRTSFVEFLPNNNKRGRPHEMVEQRIIANPGFVQLESSSLFLQERGEKYSSYMRPHTTHPFWSFSSEPPEFAILKRQTRLEQSSMCKEESFKLQKWPYGVDYDVTTANGQQRVRSFCRLGHTSSAGGYSTSTSGWSVSSHGQEGEEGEKSSSFSSQSNSSDPMETDNGYGERDDDGDGARDDNVFKEAIEHDVDLTDDLLHLVFSFLDQKSLCFSAMVCRQWRVASAHEDFWKSLCFEGENVTEEKVGWLCSKYPNAVELKLHQVPHVDEVAREAMYLLQGLRTLKLHKGILTDSFFSALASGCLCLEQLSIIDAVLGSGGSQEVLVCHENLQLLEVSGCRVMRISIRCPSLVFLSFRRTNTASAVLQCPALLYLDVSCCYKLSDSVVRAAAISCRTLLVLDISQCSYVSDETLREISGTCVNLCALDVSHCPNISLEDVSLPRLKRVRFYNCKGINSASMTALSQCVMLETVKVELCALLTSVILDMERLQNITLANCRKVADLTLRCPSLVKIITTNCPILNHISITSLALKRLVLQKQKSLTTVSLQCPLLHTIDLSECQSLSNAVCKVFSTGGGCPGLTSLVLDSCEGLTAVNLSSSSLEVLSLAGCCNMYSLELACTKLQRLNLNGCDHLTSAIFVPVGLQSLNLGICPRVTDLRIEALSMTSLDLKGCGALSRANIYCPQLISFDAFYCSRLEDKCLEATATCCPLIQCLILASCPSIGPTGLLSLRKLLSLTVLDLSYTFLTDLSPIFETCPQLKTLRLLACKYLVDTALDSLHGEKMLPELRELDLSYGSLGQTALEGLLTQCTHLTQVNINGCVNLHDLDLEGKPHPRKLSNLHRETKVQSMEGGHKLQGKNSVELEEHSKESVTNSECLLDFQSITESESSSICKWGGNKVQNCDCSNQEDMVEDEGLVPIHALQHLNCVGCPSIKKVVITHVNGFHNLFSLNLSLANNITHIRVECLQLASLNLSKCTALEFVDIKCPRLVSLWLQASNINDTLLEGAVQGCAALESLDVRNCLKLSYQCLAFVRVACPKLKQFWNSLSANPTGF